MQEWRISDRTVPFKLPGAINALGLIPAAQNTGLDRTAGMQQSDRNKEKESYAKDGPNRARAKRDPKRDQGQLSCFTLYAESPNTVRDTLPWLGNSALHTRPMIRDVPHSPGLPINHCAHAEEKARASKPAAVPA